MNATPRTIDHDYAAKSVSGDLRFYVSLHLMEVDR